MKVEDKYIPIKEYFGIKYIIIKELSFDFVYCNCYFEDGFRQIGTIPKAVIDKMFILDSPVALNVCQHSWVDVGFRFTKEVCSKCNKDKT